MEATPRNDNGNAPIYQTQSIAKWTLGMTLRNYCWTTIRVCAGKTTAEALYCISQWKVVSSRSLLEGMICMRCASLARLVAHAVAPNEGKLFNYSHG